MVDGRRHIIIGITGASGSALAKSAIEYLSGFPDVYRLSIVATDYAKKVFAHELDMLFEDFARVICEVSAARVYDNSDMFAPIASGSNCADCMIILPCSMATVAKLAGGAGDTLLTRAADVMIKERRGLVVVPRESPLSRIHLRNMLELADAGAVIAPPVPQFYGKITDVNELYAAMAGRVLLSAGIENNLYKRWGSI